MEGGMPVISVVDDDASVLSATIDLLDSAGLACEAFPSAEAYLASGRVRSTSCLILDVSMPGMNGVELKRRLIQAGHSVPTIFITAFPEERTRVQAQSHGAICYLCKPYRDHELLTCVRLALDQPGAGAVS
jgi:FixJ family two-component response regulator